MGWQGFDVLLLLLLRRLRGIVRKGEIDPDAHQIFIEAERLLRWERKVQW